MKSASIVLNTGKDDAISLAHEIIRWAPAHDVDVILEEDAAKLLGLSDMAGGVAQLVSSDFAIVLGGDGTLLRASKIFAPFNIPMLAIRFGRFGFLTDIEPEDAIQALERYLAGNYHIHERMMIRATVHRGNEVISVSDALNEVVIGKGPLSRMLRLNAYIGSRYIATYDADGLIIATPNGSTAYSLSAGGPLVAPDLEVLIITPICPHSLNIRPLIISSRYNVDVKIEGGGVNDMMLTVDGQLGISLEIGDIVSVGKSTNITKLISVNDITFFDKLQTRLRWGDRFDTGLDAR